MKKNSAFWTYFEKLGPLVMLLALIIGFTIAEPDSFFSVLNGKTILVQTTILAICTLGMTMIMVSGGLDLAVGSIVAFASVCAAQTYASSGSGILACVVAVLAGTICGGLNGYLIAGLRMNPFIATLGMMGMARGAARFVADDSRVYLRHEGESWAPKFLETTPTIEPWSQLGVSPGIILMIILTGIMIVVMRRSVFGRHVYAIGSNEESARLCGIRVDLKKFLIYSLAGLLFGIAGLLQLSYDNAGDPTTRTGFELNVIAAVVIGGASLSGGAGTIVGSIVGALIMVVLTTGFNLVGAEASVQQFVIGAIILGAVALDMFRQGTLRLPGMKA